MDKKYNRFATFNCQGLKNITKQRLIADDFVKCNLVAMIIQETHIKSNGIHEMKSTDYKTTLHLYNSGHESKSIRGVGILIRSNSKVIFTPICDRICIMTIKNYSNVTCHIISAYAPTMENTVKKPRRNKQLL